jgi:hypothetical protein
MTTGEPVETDALAVEVNAGATRVPLHEPVVDAERQAAELVAPHQVDRTACCELDHDCGDRFVTERVLPGETGEVGFRHVTAHGRRAPSVVDGRFGAARRSSAPNATGYPPTTPTIPRRRVLDRRVVATSRAEPRRLRLLSRARGPDA